MRFWRARNMSESDKRKAAAVLGEAADWFRDKLGSAKVVELVLMWVLMILSEIWFMLNYSTLNHSYRATHSTIRGYNSVGLLCFACHLREDPAFDKAWIYCVGRGQTDARMNTQVKTVLLKRESERMFVSLELERVTSMFFILFLSPAIWYIRLRKYQSPKLQSIHWSLSQSLVCFLVLMIYHLAQYVYDSIHLSQAATVFQLSHVVYFSLSYEFTGLAGWNARNLSYDGILELLLWLSGTPLCALSDLRSSDTVNLSSPCAPALACHLLLSSDVDEFGQSSHCEDAGIHMQSLYYPKQSQRVHITSEWQALGITKTVPADIQHSFPGSYHYAIDFFLIPLSSFGDDLSMTPLNLFSR